MTSRTLARTQLLWRVCQLDTGDVRHLARLVRTSRRCCQLAVPREPLSRTHQYGSPVQAHGATSILQQVACADGVSVAFPSQVLVTCGTSLPLCIDARREILTSKISKSVSTFFLTTCFPLLPSSCSMCVVLEIAKNYHPSLFRWAFNA